LQKTLNFSQGAITFYTALIFEEAETIVDPNDCALIIGVSYFLSSILGLVLKKHVGRRILLGSILLNFISAENFFEKFSSSRSGQHIYLMFYVLDF
jgi:hypothetical protein